MINNVALSEKLIDEVLAPCPRVRHIKKLLARGADINYHSSQDGRTPLMHAIKNQMHRIAEYLLMQGAYPFITNNSEEVSVYPGIKDFRLLHAVTNNNLMLVKSEIEAGALVNFQGPCGYSALMIAVHKDLYEMTEFLISQGADLTLRCDAGYEAISMTNNPDIILLIQVINKSDQDSNIPRNKRRHRFFVSPANQIGII